MANKNKNLNDAARAKKDEFYTQLEDIECELNHEEYREFFKGKTILCNCDNSYESEFFKYFAMNFNAHLSANFHTAAGLKKFCRCDNMPLEIKIKIKC